MADKLTQAGRLALRQEGNVWNAYFALPGTMEGAVFLGSLSMQFAADPVLKLAFMDFMRDVVGLLLRDATGLKAIWPEAPRSAPESERGGHS